mgnify:CR=1 FL=1
MLHRSFKICLHSLKLAVTMISVFNELGKTDLACCGVEIAQTIAGRYDIERFGAAPIVSPSHADLMIVAGTITYKVAQHLQDLYEQMPKPRYVLSIGSCANCGGLFSWEYSYSSVSGVDKLIPVDIFVPGCPPRPEAILHGLIKLQEKIYGNPRTN